MRRIEEYERIQFPDPRVANEWGVVAQGGNLSPGVLLSAYEQGIFPWYDEDPITWFSPDPRFVLYFDKFHVSRRLRRSIGAASYRVSFDDDFDAVIVACRDARRERQSGTWITGDMQSGYRELFNLGYAHAVTVRDGDELVGGLYGVAVGDLFAGESMFSSRNGGSKWAMVALVGLLDSLGVDMIDCQTRTSHLSAFGAVDIPRERYLKRLDVLRVGRRIPRDWREFDGNVMLARGLTLADDSIKRSE